MRDNGEENEIAYETLHDSAASEDTVALQDARARLRSIRIVHFAMFISSLGFSIILTGVFPYMEQLMPTGGDMVKKNALMRDYGWVVAANPLGQVIFSPLLGLLSNKLGSIRVVCILSYLTYIMGNVLYAVLSVFPQDWRLPLLIFSRFVVGASAGNAASIRAYVSAATFQSERTMQMSFLSAAQSIGFIVGPGIQAALRQFPTCDDQSLMLNMYTFTGWLSAILGLVGLLLFILPSIFIEVDVTFKQWSPSSRPGTPSSVATGEAEQHQQGEVAKLPTPDVTAVVVLLLSFFLFFNNFVILETLGTPMCMDEFAWTDDQTVLYLGIAMTAGGVVTMICFLSVGYLAKRFDERKILIFMGILPMFVARLFMFPVGGGTIVYTGNDSTSMTRVLVHQHPEQEIFHFDIRTVSGDIPPGCSYDWCKEQPALNMIQFFVGFIAFFFAYPYCISICQSIYSKVVGPRPQGLWMGVLTASGSFARVCGPVLVTYVYNTKGLYLTFAVVEAMILLSLILILLCYKRLVPLKTDEDDAAREGLPIGE